MGAVAKTLVDGSRVELLAGADAEVVEQRANSIPIRQHTGSAEHAGERTDGRQLRTRSVASGTFHTCAAGVEARAYCTGRNASGAVQPNLASDEPDRGDTLNG
jgi:hypothetical protein